MARLAQPAERKALNLVVVGSSPTVGALSALLVNQYGDLPTLEIINIHFKFSNKRKVVVSYSIFSLKTRHRTPSPMHAHDFTHYFHSAQPCDVPICRHTV